MKKEELAAFLGHSPDELQSLLKDMVKEGSLILVNAQFFTGSLLEHL